MGRNGKDDLLVKNVPIINLIEEAAEPHLNRNKTINLSSTSDNNNKIKVPSINRKPEIVHGLRNLIQNAVDFSNTVVWIDTVWDEHEIKVLISDDGDGYPTDILSRIGDPFIKRRDALTSKQKRPEYEGMGLGLFIAKTLLERSGANIEFSNGYDIKAMSPHNFQSRGAVAKVTWVRQIIEDKTKNTTIALGDNQPFEV